ncbi:MAG: preprotein translocase subunit SecY [Chloroflexi bacterium RBG_16_57_9]|nr:MAG: preprotein translocase subunit SecY [Chloroflexi bacterium RBG_16_57_9]
MLDAVRNAFKLPDLRRKILFTFFMLVIFRLAAHIPVPGVDLARLRSLFQSEEGQLLGFLNLLSGGAMENFSVVAMGVYPYITASIIMQLVVPLVPALEEISKEGEAGRQRINRYTELITIPLAALNALGQATLLNQRGVLPEFGLLTNTLPTLSIIITLTAGTIFSMWLGELITEQGIGQGISIIIFGGIVAGIPQNVGQLIASNPLALIVLIVLGIVTVAGIVFIQEGHRRIPVQYGKRIRGMRMYGGQTTHIPLRVNSAGMIPLIFASSFLIFPGVIASYFIAAPNEIVANIARSIYDVFNSAGVVYWLLYFIMVVGFTYFYTDVIFRQQNLPEALQRQGGFIPGIRPGKRTEDYLNGVLQRITLVGALFLGGVAILPFFAQTITNVQTLLITSTGLLIVVGVVLDTMKQLEAQLLMRHYEGFIK